MGGWVKVRWGGARWGEVDGMAGAGGVHVVVVVMRVVVKHVVVICMYTHLRHLELPPSRLGQSGLTLHVNVWEAAGEYPI